MTGDEIVALVRDNFGEQTAATVQDAEIQSWINAAIQELYTTLPPGELRDTIADSSVTITSGEGTIPSAADKILSVKAAAPGEITAAGDAP